MNIEELKEFSCQFDLNPKINYYLLKDLKDKNKKEYNNFIKKYKFTLDYEDAAELECFEKEEINKIKNEFLENEKKHNLNKNNIDTNNIKSLSKLKLFNLFFYY